MENLKKAINKVIRETNQMTRMGLIQFEAARIAGRVSQLIRVIQFEGDDLGYDGYRFEELKNLYNCFKGWYIKGIPALIELPPETFQVFEDWDDCNE